MLRWTDHAEQMCRERQILQAWVKETISKPEHREVDPSNEKRIRVYRRIAANDSRWLRVVYEEMLSKKLIITVFFDRNAGSWT
jgi:Domain of unknown function (DUF4258)